MIDLKTLAEGDIFEGHLAIRSKDGKGEGLKEYTNKTGMFFVIKVGNATGDVILKYWGGKNPIKPSKLFTSLEEGDVVYIKGRYAFDSYNNEPVISVNEEVKYGSPPEFLKKAASDSFDVKEFVAALPDERIEELFSQLIDFIKGIENQHLKVLLEGFFKDFEFARRFKETPAAKSNHHNYIGGLLEHSVNAAVLSKILAGLYPIDRDLLIAGALLHDLGKMEEYRVSASIEVTEQGRFVGHLMIGSDMVRAAIREMKDFPDDLEWKLIHMLLSHHGELEKGSPKLPAFPEAVALFHIDYLDAFTKNAIQEIEGAGDVDWAYSRSFKRFFHIGKAMK